MTVDEIYNCTHQTLRGPTPSMMEDGDYRQVCADCFAAVKPHTCNLRDIWPTGHPLPPVDPARLTGPAVGTLCVVGSKYRPGLVVRVMEQSYVWSPGECRHRGGYRNYDWSVVSDEHGYRVVMNDSDLIPLVPGMTVTIDKVV